MSKDKIDMIEVSLLDSEQNGETLRFADAQEACEYFISMLLGTSCQQPR